MVDAEYVAKAEGELKAASHKLRSWKPRSRKSSYECNNWNGDVTRIKQIIKLANAARSR